MKLAGDIKWSSLAVVLTSYPTVLYHQNRCQLRTRFEPLPPSTSDEDLPHYSPESPNISQETPPSITAETEPTVQARPVNAPRRSSHVKKAPAWHKDYLMTLIN